MVCDVLSLRVEDKVLRNERWVPRDGSEMEDPGRGSRGCLSCHMSLHVARVKPEQESSPSPSQVRVTNQVPESGSFSFVFFFLLLRFRLDQRLLDCDSCFHNDVPTDVKSIIVNAITRIHCW